MSLQLPLVLAQPATVGAHLLGHYVHDRHSNGAPYYSGSMFESFLPTDPDRISAEDILAVSRAPVEGGRR